MNRKRILNILLWAVAVIVTVYSGAYFAVQKAQLLKDDDNHNTNEITQSDGYLSISFEGKEYEYNQSITTLTFMGVDGDQGDPLSGQSDFMDLIVFNRDDKKISQLLIPRDTMALVYEYDSDGNVVKAFTSQIAVAYPFGGSSPSARARNALRSISAMLNGILLDHYVVLPLNILPDLVDVFGETDIVLEDDSLSHIDDKYVTGYAYHIDKESIETFLKSRDINEEYSATARLNRQQLYLDFVLNSLNKLNEGDLDLSLSKLVELLDKCSSNLTRGSIENYLNYFKEYKENGIDRYRVPGSVQKPDKFDEFIIDRSAFDGIIVKIFYKEKRGR